MALTLRDLFVGSIVDWVTEWCEDGKERQRNPIRRGIIVKLDGAASEQSVTKVYVHFNSAGDEIEVNGKRITAVVAKAAELVVAFDHESKESRVAWRRIFGSPVNVGAEFAARKNSSNRKIIRDELGLTPRPKDAVVTDANDDGVEDMELPDAQA